MSTVSRHTITGMLCFLLFCLLCMYCSADGNDPEIFFSKGIEARNNNQYHTAYDSFVSAMEGFLKADNPEMAQKSFTLAKETGWILTEMTLNRTEAEKIIQTNLPWADEDQIQNYLTPKNAIQMQSDNETWYFSGLINNIYYHNQSLIRSVTEKEQNSYFFDQMIPVIREKNLTGTEKPVSHTYTGIGSASIPRDTLPANGILRAWIPLPTETDSQKNVSVLFLEPAEYLVSGPHTTGEIGVAYFEIPVKDIRTQNLTISVSVEFTTNNRILMVDPNKIRPYDTNSDLYRTYTGSQDNIKVTPGIRALALSIIGDEKNPYFMAKRIYDFIITTFPYSNVPHTYLAAKGIPESEFMHTTGFGDCGTQSTYFTALCRSVGIPARTCGGYQLFPGEAGPHFWAEFYLPEYGWVPVDVTLAEAGDWAYNATEEELALYKEYYFGNLDPYRCTIQNDVDQVLIPDPGDDLLFTVAFQSLETASDTATIDPELTYIGLWSYSFTDISKE
ncbi:MAG: transglutaminase domain-containing protein [Methanospirillaceae archaeon]|nr:transglutaminase domain-containing protein [Methanospirillaceae archaeon]